MLNHPHATWEHLHVLLGEMQELFKIFLSLLSQEECFLLAMDRQGVADMTEKKEQVLDEMCRYEQQALDTMHRLAGPDHQGHLADWLRNLSHRQAVSAKSKFQDLIGLTRMIQEQGKKNESSIQRMQHIVREAIHLIYAGVGTGPVYQGSGALRTPSVLSSVQLQG
ncbi:MAG: flagellar protein FlgN [Nitrospirota bacterium]|nr:flagellar protein FlgN [Nitrospirota bacterium]MDH5586125.1 flagellar protein FlgN [Nitrospirota bacterium]MDH5775764.1 flagellar protein FlgN [Nitrospirota bacterium]